MRKYLPLLLFFLFVPNLALASLASKLAGQILLNVEKNGEAWYVYPEDERRYYLGRPHDAFQIMRELGLGIREVDFQRLAKAGMPVPGDWELANELKGKIILQVEKNGEAWYVYPEDLKIYYLGRPHDAWRIMRELSLGINQEDLAQVHKPGLSESLSQYSSYEHIMVSTELGNFGVDVVRIDLTNPKLNIITDTATRIDCDKDCPANTLGSFVLRHNAFAGINGTYFCTSAGCEKNYYFYPVYNTMEEKLTNEDQLKYWTTGPIMAWDEDNKFYYFKDSREFVSVEKFEQTIGKKLQAALGNKPRLIESGLNQLIEWDIDAKQRTARANRNAVGYKDEMLYLVVARNATVPDLAIIMQELDMEYALNLDGGYSSALWYNDEYMVGPGRNIPNAIIFSEE